MNKSFPMFLLLFAIWDVSQAQPDLISPTNGSTVSATDTLKWSYSSPVLNVIYTVKWAPDSTFPVTAESTTTLASTYVHVFGTGVWYWKVKAQGLWSVTWHFTTKPVSVFPFSPWKTAPKKDFRYFDPLGRTVTRDVPLGIIYHTGGFAY